VWRLEWNRAFVGAALMSAMCLSQAQAGTCSNLPSWTSGPPLAAAVYGPASASDGTYVYAASGGICFTGCGMSPQFRRYDRSLNVWQPLADVPIPVFGATLVYDAAGGRLFLFGGVGPPVLTTVQIYTIATNTWDPNGPPLPLPRYGMAGGAIGGKIYLVGGIQSGTSQAQSQNWEFDPATGTYVDKLPLPTPQARSGYVVREGQLYVIAGHNDAGVLVLKNYRYTPSTNAWETLADIDEVHNQPGAVALGAMTPECHGDIMIVSGGTPALEKANSDPSRTPESTPITRLYDVATNSWSLGPQLPSGRFALRAEQAGDTIIAFGGYDGANTVATVDRMQGPPLPVALQSFSVE
jgi:hypothetical protein